MNSKSKKNYPLQVAISTLFISITAILGIILIWQSYSKTSDIMLSNAKDIHSRITQALIYDFKATYGPITSGLRQIRLSPVIKAETYEQRFKFIQNFIASLESTPSIFVAGIAYNNGDYFGVTSVASDYIKKQHTVPVTAQYAVLYFKKSIADADFQPNRLYTIFYDTKLNELSRSVGKETDLDLRDRDWYQQAKLKPQATKPYIFYDTDIVGLTVTTKTAQTGVVISFDVTLQQLNETLLKYDLTPNSEVVLINAQGQTYAYKDQSKVVIKKANNASDAALQLANLKQLDSEVLKFLSETFKIQAKEQNLNFKFKNKRWIGSARVIAKPGGVDLYALILSPVEELLVDAVAVRSQLIVTVIIILAIFFPLIWFASKKISTPLNLLARQADAISHFDFKDTKLQSSLVKEVNNLSSAMTMMKSTINKFIKLINSLAGEQDLEALLKSISTETMLISQSDAVLVYLMDDKDDLLKADFLVDKNNNEMSTEEFHDLTLNEASTFFSDDKIIKSLILKLDENTDTPLNPLLNSLNSDSLSCIILPLQNRNNELIGVLSLIYKQHDRVEQVSNIEFVEALSGFAAVTLESRQLFDMQEALLNSFIKLIAGAIDAKSPYTGGHCQRVPEITLMLAKAACESKNNKFVDFDLDPKQWQELSIACWLHDCGKVTTPEYVVDKATKLETIYDRIHEVRMRFEVLKRDAEIECWQAIAKGDDKKSLLAKLEKQVSAIDDDFAFVAECNIGGEFMDGEKITRLESISKLTWLRTMDDSAGVSWEESARKSSNDTSLPVTENLLSDKTEHLIARHETDKLPKDNQWGFKVDTPEHKYNRGEVYNLSVQRGTLTEEERYMINGHMIQTIIMLNNLPYPKSLRNVPLIAGSHHETMDGKGYPKRLLMSEQPLTSRMMVIADIFEALTASDRPYKKPKTLSESIRILSFMRNDKHIDADLFDLFLTSGVYLQYAEQFLSPDQIDAVSISDYLS